MGEEILLPSASSTSSFCYSKLELFIITGKIILDSIENTQSK